MEIFAKRLKVLRKEKQLTQKQVADMLKIRQQSYVRYELGTGEPSLDTLVLLCKILETNSDYLLGIEE